MARVFLSNAALSLDRFSRHPLRAPSDLPGRKMQDTLRASPLVALSARDQRRALPASEAHTSTSDRPVADPGNRIADWESKGRFQQLWKRPGTRPLGRRRPCATRHLPAPCCSSHRGKSRSSARCSRLPACRPAHFWPAVSGRRRLSRRCESLRALFRAVVPGRGTLGQERGLVQCPTNFSNACRRRAWQSL